jgi:CheY-like chemotaxis protein
MAAAGEAPDDREPAPGASGGAAVLAFADDSESIQPDDRVLLIIENDVNFARLLLDVAHENGFKAIVASRGAQALQAAMEHVPSGITLDINLPDIDGWRVLDRLKDDPATRHIPVQIITTEEEHERGLRMGAIGALTKPLKTREALDRTLERIKRHIEPAGMSILLVEPDEARRRQLQGLLSFGAPGDAEGGEPGASGIQVITTATAAEALEAIAAAAKSDPTPIGGPRRAFAAIILDVDLPDRKCFDLIDEIIEDPAVGETPLIVYSERSLSKKEETHLKRLSQTLVLKDVRSPQRLLDDVTLFLHRPLATLPPERRRMIEQLHDASSVLAGKTVLVVDDDIRNIFAMTSILESQNMHVLSAETGRAAIETLQQRPDIDVVLMDIMMPDMDGCDTMRAIRKLAKFRALPIIALTAKAMKGDREKCIEAGASDYISKPVDTQQLLGLLRTWLYR